MLLECKIYFALGVQNLFCSWSEKFIWLLFVFDLLMLKDLCVPTYINCILTFKKNGRGRTRKGSPFEF
ncbi:MAG: hypothetical protein DRR00_13415 [Candidatus Parabeggiatoa sp. nov. 3]|nr:MAG: hypothetical protein DRR00_13415 [Gammaproteobacteria bacterium]RKZ62394.1 MAG: hypothetical protein DRQ99_18810 [Gammaproteobacteria bacterium]